MKTIDAVNAFLRSGRSGNRSPETTRWYKGILVPFAQMFPELPDDPDSIEQFLLSCTAGDERRHGYYRAVRALYRYAKRRFETKNPVDRVTAPKCRKKKPRPLTLDELAQLLEFPHPGQIKAALMFLADTGARVGELANLKPYDLSKTEFGYVARITGKTGTRLVPVSHETHEVLMPYLPFHYSPYRLRRLISRAFKDAHVKGTAHTLRHTFATYWEGDELILQQIMGHSSLSTTKIYRYLRTHRISEQHRQYSPLHMLAKLQQLQMHFET